jgi:prepilin-type processing-associated H-X9-DG protein
MVTLCCPATMLVAAAPPADVAAPSPAPAAPAAAPAGAQPPVYSRGANYDAAAPQAAPSRLLAYIPEDADFAMLARVGLLMRTERGRKIVALQKQLIASACEAFPKAIDLEKNVAGMACVYAFDVGDKEEGPRSGAILIFDMTEDIRPADVVPELAVPRSVSGFIAYPLGDEWALVGAGPRVVMVASLAGPAESVGLARVRDHLNRARPKPADGLPLAALEPASEITFAARPSETLKEVFQSQYDAMRRQTLRPGLGAEQLVTFAINYNMVRLVLQTETVTGSVDLGREADALRADVRFAAKPMAPFFVTILQAMADPLQMGLPALAGGEPLEEPPPEPFYRAAADGQTVHVTMSDAAVERFTVRLLGPLRFAADTKQSAANLFAIGKAVQEYVNAKGAYPQNWSDLVKASLVAERMLENPARADHPDSGDYDLVPLPGDLPSNQRVTTVNAYEIWPKIGRPRGLNVLFADGHVEYMDYTEFEQVYRLTLRRLGR